MKIEWNKVTWYSKVLAVLVFIATFYIAFQLGSLYQQAEDYSTANHIAPPVSARYKGMLICAGNGDCPVGETCLRPGPIIAGEVTPKVCVPSGQAVPL